MVMSAERTAAASSRRGADSQPAAAPDGCDCLCTALLMLLRCMQILLRLISRSVAFSVGWLSRSSRRSAAVSGWWRGTGAEAAARLASQLVVAGGVAAAIGRCRRVDQLVPPLLADFRCGCGRTSGDCCGAARSARCPRETRPSGAPRRTSRGKQGRREQAAAMAREYYSNGLDVCCVPIRVLVLACACPAGRMGPPVSLCSLLVRWLPLTVAAVECGRGRCLPGCLLAVYRCSHLRATTSSPTNSCSGPGA